MKQKASKYVVVFPLLGAARRYHLSLTKDLAERFSIENLSDKILPHVTLKYIGLVNDSERIEDLEDVLRRFCNAEKKFPVTLSGIGNFGNKFIFMDVACSQKLADFYGRFYSSITSLDWVPQLDYEGKAAHFHSTLAGEDMGSKFKRIYDYLSNRNPNYSFDLNKLHLMQKSGSKWRVYRTFKIKC